MNTTQNITLDLTKRTVFQYVSAKQGDDGSRFVKITLTDNGVVYKPPADTAANFRAQKPDDTMVLNPAIVDGDGTVTVELTQQTLAVVGDVLADIVLSNSRNEILSTVSFLIHVEPAPYGTKVDSQNEFLVFSGYVEKAEQAAARSEQSANRSEQAASQAADKLPLAGGTMHGPINLGGNRLHDVADPHNPKDAINLTFADGRYARAVARGDYSDDIDHIDDGAHLHGNSVVWIGPGTGTKNLPRQEYGFCLTLDNGSGYTQTIHFIDGTVCKRVYFDGSEPAGRHWTEWEWENPPASVGVEYRTSEKFDGRPVYTKLYKVPNAVQGSRIQTGIGSVIRYSGTIARISLPYFGSDGFNGQFAAWLEVNEGFVVVNSRGFSPADVYVQLWYVK